MPRKTMVLAISLLMSTSALAVPLELSHQGRLFDDSGVPLNGAHDLTLALHNAPAGGNLLWMDTFTDVTFDHGYYNIQLGSSAALTAGPFDGDDVYLELAINSAPALSRTRIVSVPFAVRAQSATSVNGGVVNASEIQIDGTTVIDSTGQLVSAGGTLSALTCTTNDVAYYNGTQWACGPRDLPHTHTAADINDGVLAVARLPVGTTAGMVSPGDHGHPLTALTGAITDAQLPSNMGAVVDSYVIDGPLDLDGGTQLGGATISTGNHYTDGQATAAMGAKAITNPLNHDRLTHPQIVAAVEAEPTLNVAGIVSHNRHYYRDYRVSTTVTLPFLNRAGNAVGTDFRALIQCSVIGTGAPGNSLWLVTRRSGDILYIDKISSLGSVSSNTPELYNDGTGKLRIRLYTHPNQYTVRCTTQSNAGGE